MGYIEQTLVGDESIVYKGHLHWIVYLPAVLWFFTFLICYQITSNLPSTDEAAGPVFAFGLGAFISIIASIYKVIQAWIFRISTELAVTTKRVIAKTGFIKRDTIELTHSKVESFTVNQSILGRVLNYGTVTVNGTGGIKTPVPNVSDPLEFRKRAMETIEP